MMQKSKKGGDKVLAKAKRELEARQKNRMAAERKKRAGAYSRKGKK